MKFKSPFTRINDLKEERLAICRNCELFDSKKVKCNACGCFLNYKAMMPSARCPLDKWIEKPDEFPEY